MDSHLQFFDFSPAAQATIDDQEILDNIDGRMHGPMSGFMEKYFGKFRYICQGASLEIQVAERVRIRCTIPSAAPSPSIFLEWFSNYVSRESDGARGLWHICEDKIASKRESTADGTSLLLAMPPSPACDDAETKWCHVQVIGQFYHRGCVCYQDGLLSLCRSAHQVFANQPTRLFLHGFYIRGSLIELWVFDRSGLYCSDVFDVQKDFIRFLSVILSYQRMTDQDLGKLDIIETDRAGGYMMLDGAEMPSLRKIYLESQPIASREGLVGTGTTCYRVRSPESRRWSSVLKLKWRWARERPENELLQLASESRVWGAVSLDYYKEVESTAHLRRGLRWGTQRKFTGLPPPETHRILEEQCGQVDYNADGFVDYTKETGNFFQNRILTCAVTSPAGRPLHTFQSLTELLQVFRDAVKCHRSLRHDAKILHQDISSGNIIILDEQGEGKPKGVLIDLDSAIQLTEELETDVEITGTRPFMAIGVLRGEHHSYRHDLESFLYVFLWIVISSHSENPPEMSKLRHWSNGDWNELAIRKCLDMGQDNFAIILREFTPEFHSLKSLAEGLRQILFPLEDGVIWTGTHGSPEAVDELYDGMIRAFEGAIANEGGR
ncbi:serine/threonine-protein kinase Sgk2 [Metarhizium guizhouense ARSEF 977]|uniref:non-specific serine/threonine protein kinase n=1 Tax=Metarhizium guizhouense (strain ARSEF 977) TaxID=1276136 RepID=A0A0B4G3K7_METGA|nr:serine/threonine-protein kinase Sgk2 [Metarhizium guizhouense ARSEF 977]